MNRKLIRSRCALRLILTLVPALAASPGLAGDNSVGIDINSAYVWRGITLNDGAVIQPWLEASLPAGISIGAWANVDLDDYDNSFEEGDCSEVDFTLSHTREVGPVELGIGYAEFLYPHQGDTNGATAGTREISASVSTVVAKGLSLSASLMFDIDEVDDLYAVFGATYETAVNDQLTVTIKAVAGWAGEDWSEYNSGGTDGGLHDYRLSLTGAYGVTDTLELGAGVSYVDSLDEDVLPDQDVDVYGGVSVSYGF